MGFCKICNEVNADKTNSHIIPSFLAALFFSYDGSGKRGKELMFTLSSSQRTVYTGGLPSTKIEDVFDMNTLTEERIKNELSKNTIARDYIFCSNCERFLSVYLESPYSRKVKEGHRVEADISLLFWLSVVWRMSLVGDLGFKLPSFLEEELRQKLDIFFKLKENNADVSQLVEEIQFNYRIVRCTDFCKSYGGSIYSEYDEVKNVLTSMIGDFCLCITFDEESLPEDYSFYDLEIYINKASVNNGQVDETILEVPINDYHSSVEKYARFFTSIEIARGLIILDCLWIESGCIGHMPIRMKMLIFNDMSESEAKIGDKYTLDQYRNTFNRLIKNVWLWY